MAEACWLRFLAALICPYRSVDFLIRSQVLTLRGEDRELLYSFANYVLDSDRLELRRNAFNFRVRVRMTLL
jgi:hypothetical protein